MVVDLANYSVNIRGAWFLKVVTLGSTYYGDVSEKKNKIEEKIKKKNKEKITSSKNIHSKENGVLILVPYSDGRYIYGSCHL